MTTLIEHLESLNRKERFILLHEALGEDTFSLDEGFRARLSKAIGVGIPEDVFVAMDYHLDWIQMALHLTEHGVPRTPIPDGEQELFEADQKDVDLLVAFYVEPTTHVVLVEAKMETGWNNRQLRSKAKRLQRIFGEDGTRYGFAKPHFVLASPKESKRIDTEKWPSWMASIGVPNWVKLPRPQNLIKVTRCSQEGETSESGGHLRIDSVPQDS